MDFRSYDTLSQPVRAQLDRLTELWQRRLGGALTGVYLHGSMALGCFREGVSDVDALIVTARRIPRAERLAIAGDILTIDQAPCPLELSAIYEGDLIPWSHPTVCQFHYSDYHRENYKKLLRGELSEYAIVDRDFQDPDVACHVRLTRQCGVCLFGKPIGEVFPEVPEADFLDSLCQDVDDYDFHAYQPRYFASNILILGRILSYLKEGRILSKYDGGLWTAAHVPAASRPIVEAALRSWYAGEPMPVFDSAALESLRSFLIGEIRARRGQPPSN